MIIPSSALLNNEEYETRSEIFFIITDKLRAAKFFILSERVLRGKGFCAAEFSAFHRTEKPPPRHGSEGAAVKPLCFVFSF